MYKCSYMGGPLRVELTSHGKVTPIANLKSNGMRTRAPRQVSSPRSRGRGRGARKRPRPTRKQRPCPPSFSLRSCAGVMRSESSNIYLHFLRLCAGNALQTCHLICVLSLTPPVLTWINKAFLAGAHRCLHLHLSISFITRALANSKTESIYY